MHPGNQFMQVKRILGTVHVVDAVSQVHHEVGFEPSHLTEKLFKQQGGVASQLRAMVAPCMNIRNNTDPQATWPQAVCPILAHLQEPPIP